MKMFLKKIKDGDKVAFEYFANGAISKLYRAVFRFLRDHDSSEDVVKMTLVKFLDNVKKVKHSSIGGGFIKSL